MEFTPQPISKLLSQSKRKPAQMRKGKSTEAEEMMITDWISSNLPLCHEGLRRRLQVPLQQIVINIHVKPAPQARESINNNRTGKGRINQREHTSKSLTSYPLPSCSAPFCIVGSSIGHGCTPDSFCKKIQVSR